MDVKQRACNLFTILGAKYSMLGRFVAIAFFSCSCSLSVFAQTEASETTVVPSPKETAIGITFGVGELEMRDQVISNYLYSRSYKPLGFYYEKRKRYSKQFFSWEFMNSPQLKTGTNDGFEYKGDLGTFYPTDTLGYSINTVKSKMNAIHLTFLGLLKKTETKRIKVFLGGELGILKFNKNFLQFESINKLTDRVISLGFVCNLERNFNQKHHLEYNLSIPMLNLVKRELYNADASPTTVYSNQKLASFGDVLGFDNRLTYRFQVSNSISFRFTYSFQYLQVSFPNKEQWAYNQGVVGLFFHF